MSKNFQQVEDVLADEQFQAWYSQKSEEQTMEWEQWLTENSQYQLLVQEAVAFMNQLPRKESLLSTDLLEQKLQQLNDRIDETETVVVPMKTSQRRWWMSAAAAILLLIGGFTFFKLTQSSTKKLDATYGEIRSNQLPDGSTMILNANSSAKLSEGWEEGKDREVWLDGEAFFKVTKTAKKSRFIVHTGDLDVIVTGTQFNVLHRNNKTTVLLTEGSVIIRTADGKELAMKPGDYIEMEDNMVARKTAKEENVLAWKDNMIVFDNTPLSKAAQLIRDHYGVNITLADESVAAKTLTGMMPNNNLDGLLEAIEIAAEIRVTKNGKEIIFTHDRQ